MTPELDKKLCEKYPKIFVQRNLPPQKTAMYWGFECGDGWYNILDSLCAVIQNHCDPKYNTHPGPEVVAVQVKEKFGTLRFYTESHDDYVDGAIRVAERLSGCTCEDCGKPGKRRDGGWIRTLCDECADRQNV